MRRRVALTWSIATAVLMACGASANDPGTGKKGDAGDIPLYDAGSDYFDTGADEDGGGSGCDTTSVLNCGSCGNVCPGLDAAAAVVSCGGDGGASECAFACQGEHYDVNDDASDGCEVTDTPTGNHQASSAFDLGSASCHDDSSAQNLSGVMPSDRRAHEDPTVSGHQPTTGAAPDYWTIVGSGGTCYNDLNLTLTLTGAKSPSCYTLTATTSGHGPYTCTPPNGQNYCDISNGSGSYDDGATIVWFVTKTCSTAETEDVSYTITGHL